MTTRWRQTTWRCPTRLLGTDRRVWVRLRNGMEPKETWAAWGKNGCRWESSGHPFDITHYRLEHDKPGDDQ